MGIWKIQTHQKTIIKMVNYLLLPAELETHGIQEPPPVFIAKYPNNTIITHKLPMIRTPSINH